jgi:hypothetical protein
MNHSPPQPPHDPTNSVESPSVPETRISQQLLEIQRLRSVESALTQERDEWFTRYTIERQEVFRLTGVSCRQNHTITALQDTVVELRAALLAALHQNENKAAEPEQQIIRLKADLVETNAAAISCYPEATAASDETIRFKTRSAEHELDALRSQLIDLQQHNAQLRKLHKQTIEEMDVVM